jgi:hypothetical protein
MSRFLAHALGRVKSTKVSAVLGPNLSFVPGRSGIPAAKHGKWNRDYSCEQISSAKEQGEK